MDIVWLYGCGVIWRYIAIWVYGYMARAWYGCIYTIWLYGYMTLLLWHGLAVYGYMTRPLLWLLKPYGYAMVWLCMTIGL